MYKCTDADDSFWLVYLCSYGRKEIGNDLVNDAFNTFLFTVISCETYGKELLSKRGNPLLPLYASSHRQDSIYPGLCRGAQAWTRNSSLCPSQGIDPSHHEYMLYQGASSCCGRKEGRKRFTNGYMVSDGFMDTHFIM